MAVGVEVATVRAENVVLLSGGLGSAVCLQMANDLGPTHALTVDYGNKVEVAASRALMRGVVGVSHRVVEADLAPKWANVYTTGHSCVLMAMGLTEADLVGASTVWFGACLDTALTVPDCRPTHVSALRGYLRAVGSRTRIETPLLTKPRVEVIQMALDYRVRVSNTVSCRRLDVDSPCGTCDACLARKRAEQELSL